VTPIVDLVILTRDVGPLDLEVERGFCGQRDVGLIVHRVIGCTDPRDRCRWDAIARARNEGRLRGTTPWLMFLDDDVVLEPQCIATLVVELNRRPAYAALAAEYLGERRAGRIARHVSMGATLFRRQVLKRLHFTSRHNKCECQCCCDDLRRLHWGIDYCDDAIARHLPKSENSGNSFVQHHGHDNTIVTCLCVTRGRVPMLRRAIQCYLNQTYPDRELVVVYESDDTATRQLLADLRDSSIYPIEVPAVPRLKLGSLRNIARQAGTGRYVAQWDDDDWYSPERLAEQMRAIRETRKPGCLLARWTMYECESKHAYISNVRPWEGSIVVERAFLSPYPDVSRSEDTAVVGELMRRCQLTMLDRPELYVYTHHGANTWDRQHWEQFRSQPLGKEVDATLTELLDLESPSAASRQEFRLGISCKTPSV
jgi:Glycosyl transferase family 2